MKIGGFFVYFSAMMDLYTRKIVGTDISRKRNADMVMSTLSRSLKATSGCCPKVFHSDRGIEYANHVVGEQLKGLGVSQSMPGKGNCYDNAHMESFFHTYKSELYYPEPLRSFDEFKTKTTSYIRFYNKRRLHSSVEYRSPVEFETHAMEGVNF